MEFYPLEEKSLRQARSGLIGAGVFLALSLAGAGVLCAFLTSANRPLNLALMIVLSSLSGLVFYGALYGLYEPRRKALALAKRFSQEQKTEIVGVWGQELRPITLQNGLPFRQIEIIGGERKGIYFVPQTCAFSFRSGDPVRALAVDHYLYSLEEKNDGHA
jgi:hypothetical protein